ncbi:MAG: Asp-tRNA(Asn)/Glu-tRNA(Gln) amidotransferase subunit GatB [candidate division FCPU426 bacterium]
MGHDYEVVIGLEVHAELATASKVFCGCPTAFGAPPNTQTCPVCLGLPGSLPVFNRRVLELAAKAALALGCEIAPHTKFDRKNYFYPDLPKAYQISQYDLPLARHGRLLIDLPEGSKSIGITRVHIEEDAGKLLHQTAGGQIGRAASSLVDYNRAGVPLIEIVSEPDLRSPEEAYAYLTELKAILRYTEVSDCNMEEGSLRCDANISVRPRGQQALGAKIEVKNMNSFKNVRDALAYEAKRQVQAVSEGAVLTQETRLWDAEQGKTLPMRGKEEAHDYRYFPEPDLPLLELEPAWIEDRRRELPELPRARRERLQKLPQLTAYDAGVLTSSRMLADFFDAAVASAPPKAVSNWLTGDYLGRLNAEGKDLEYETIATLPISPSQLGQLATLTSSGEISSKIGKQVFEEMYATGKDPDEIIKSKGLSQISDPQALAKLVEQAIAENPGPAAEYRKGKQQALGFLVGQVMKASQGKANPQRVNQLLREKLQ